MINIRVLPKNTTSVTKKFEVRDQLDVISTIMIIITRYKFVVYD